MADETAHQLSWYSFIGRILGKALYDGILVDVSFAGFFRELLDARDRCRRRSADMVVAKWLGRQSYLDDLNSLDAELYKGLTSKLRLLICSNLALADTAVLKNYTQPEDLALNFTISKDEFGVNKTVDLIPGGSDIAVTAENRAECELSDSLAPITLHRVQS